MQSSSQSFWFSSGWALGPDDLGEVRQGRTVMVEGLIVGRIPRPAIATVANPRSSLPGSDATRCGSGEAGATGHRTPREEYAAPSWLFHLVTMPLPQGRREHSDFRHLCSGVTAPHGQANLTCHVPDSRGPPGADHQGLGEILPGASEVVLHAIDIIDVR